MAEKHPISRKYIYPVLIGFDAIASAIRPFLFPGQGWIFHLSLFAGTTLITLFIWEFIIISSRFLERPFPINSNPVSRMVIQVLLSFLFSCIIGYTIFGAAEKIFNVDTPQSIDAMIPFLYLLSSIMLNLMHFGVYYFREWKKNILRTERLQREQAEVRYDALRNQLNPHFLFNALTSLNSLIFENQQLASDFLQQLSKVYRYTLQHKDKETVTLKTELDFIGNYISLFKIRFEDAIIFKLEINEHSKELGIPPVTLQMLVENAVKHNIINTSHPLTISISSTEDTLSVINNISRKSQVETSNKQGLDNLKTLYKYLSDRPVEIIEDSHQFTVNIPLI